MDNPVATPSMEDFDHSPSLDMETTQDIENLLGIVPTNQRNVEEASNSSSKNEEALLSEERNEGITLYRNTSDEGESVNEGHGQVELSLNSSECAISGSPQDLSISSRIVTVAPPSADPLSRGDDVTLDPSVRMIQVQSPSESHHGGSYVQTPYSPDWIKQLYPELHSVWLENSGSQFYQGGVKMLCSRCKTQLASGFHEGLPLCEACRVDLACTVCRIRVTSCFSHGLAVCEADRVFLHRSLTNRTSYNKCEVMCPVTVQRWCSYCRLRACLSVKGFSFPVSTSTGHLSSDQPLHKLRKYSGTGSYKELNFLPDSINQDTIYFPPPERQSANVNAYQQTPLQANQAQVAYDQVFHPIPKYSVKAYKVSRIIPSANQGIIAPGHQVITQPKVKVYDGSCLGLDRENESWRPGLISDPRRRELVKQQQEKYLQYHLAIYRSRMNN